MMLPRPSDRSSHLPEEHRLVTLISQFCTFSIVPEGGTLAAHGLREPGRVYECRQKSGSADRAVLASDRYAKLAFVPPIYPPTGIVSRRTCTLCLTSLTTAPRGCKHRKALALYAVCSHCPYVPPGVCVLDLRGGAGGSGGWLAGWLAQRS